VVPAASRPPMACIFPFKATTPAAPRGAESGASARQRSVAGSYSKTRFTGPTWMLATNPPTT
jgi:hypothetical protein